jgi:hypothetical protein
MPMRVLLPMRRRLDRLPEPQRTPATTEVLAIQFSDDRKPLPVCPGPALGHAQARPVYAPGAPGGASATSTAPPGAPAEKPKPRRRWGTDRVTKRAVRVV